MRGKRLKSGTPKVYWVYPILPDFHFYSPSQDKVIIYLISIINSMELLLYPPGLNFIYYDSDWLVPDESREMVVHNSRLMH